MPSPEITHTLFTAVDDLFAAEVEFLAELVRIPSLRGQEAPAIDFMARAYADRGYSVDRWRLHLEDIQHLAGFSPVVHANYANAWSVVGAHRPARPRGRSLILNGHVDVVPTGPEDMWRSPPFSPRVENGWMFGRGAGDMKAGLTINLFAMQALAHAGFRPAADVYLQTNIEEECTGNGALAMMQRGYRADAVVITEPSDEMLDEAEVGVIWLQVEVRGRPAHVQEAGQGFNAIEACFPLIQALHAMEARWNAEKHPAYASHPHPLNIVLTKIEGGDWTSSVPAWCRFDVRIGIYPERAVADAQREIEEVIRAAAANSAFLVRNPPRLTYHGFLASGYLLPPDTDAERVLGAAHTTVTQTPLTHDISPALTDARIFALHSAAPVLVYGPRCERPHAFDECVDLASVRRVTKTLALFIADWCGLDEVQNDLGK